MEKDYSGDKKFVDMNGKLVDLKKSKFDTSFEKKVALAYKVDRHEKWLHQVAEKLDIKLEY